MKRDDLAVSAVLRASVPSTRLAAALALLLVSLLVLTAQPALAGNGQPANAAANQKTQVTRVHKNPRVYGAPIQAPILKKRTKRGATPAAAKTKTTAAARAAAARKAQAALEYRRAHPAVSQGPR